MFIESEEPIENIVIKSNKSNLREYTHVDFINNPEFINKLKLAELKSLAKEYKLHVSGTKIILIERIIINFIRINKTIIIQRIFRGYLVRASFSLRGEGFKNRSICINSSDFYTLEPVADIDFRRFFSYSDNNNFYYGFDIESLNTLMTKTTKICIHNPYNREKIPQHVLDKIKSLEHKIRILFKDILEPIFLNKYPGRNTIIDRPRVSIITESNRENSLFNRISTPEIHSLHIIRLLPINTRIQELFMEIDQLGNYTNNEWFSSLNRDQYVRLYRLIYNIWRRLSIDVRNKICILGDPFINIFSSNIHINEIAFERIKEACLIVLENMVFTGIDIEYRKIGALHVLSALTVVSPNARVAIPWLYDTLIY